MPSSFFTNQKKNFLFLSGIFLLGSSLRLIATLRGHNYDFDSYIIVLEIIKKGGNVYAETQRYNYGPLWFNIMWALYNIANKDHAIFRILLTLLLSLADAGIALILLKRYNYLAGILFFFNPISILITGYHNQFDNLALLLALFSAVLTGNNFTESINKRKFWGLVILGISLIVKHTFFIYPVWLALKQKGLANKLWTLLIPSALFLLSFIPYADAGSTGIINNVFLYRSYGNGIFYHFFIPFIIQILLTKEMFWIATLLFFGYYFRNVHNVESCLYYTCVLVATAPSIANQYLAIPIPFIAVHINIFSILYTLFGSIHLLVDIDGLHLFTLSKNSDFLRVFFYLILVSFLSLSFVSTLIKNNRTEEKGHTIQHQ